MSPCNSNVGLYFKGACDIISVTMTMHKVHKCVLYMSVFVNYLRIQSNLVTYHFYFFIRQFPIFFNFSDSKEKSYLVELNIYLKENAFYGLQKILPDNFP